MNKNTFSSEDKQGISPKNANPTLFNLSGFNKKPVEVRFSLDETSSDGGLLLLNEIDKQIGLCEKLSQCIKDHRHQSYVCHSIGSMVRQRTMQIAAGYEDANDCNFLKDDGIIKLCSQSDKPLATQPTMCRLENQPKPTGLYKMAKVFVGHFIGPYTGAPKFIVLDCDDTSALAYGQQQLALFNTYYGEPLLYALAHLRRGIWQAGKSYN